MESLTKAEITQRMLDKLEGSGLSSADAKVLGVQPCTAEEAARRKLAVAAPCFIIPYFDSSGKQVSFYRARYVVDTRKGFERAAGKKPLRYAQPPNSQTSVYFPPLMRWQEIAADVTTPLYITEGELKAACACRYGIPCLGLGGVWSFQSNKLNLPMLTEFENFDFAEREVSIVFDSDAVNNPMIVEAENRLARRLTERGALVSVVRLPALPELAKTGLDDLLVLRGKDEFDLLLQDRTFEYSASAVLHGINQEVIYVRDPGFVYRFDGDQRITVAAFKEHAFSNRHVFEQHYSKNGEPRMEKKPAAPLWVQWEFRNEVRGLDFAPGEDRITEEGLLNTWTGWGLPRGPEEGDVSEWHRLLDHLFGADAAARRWFEAWCAAPLQKPGLKQHCAVAIWGPEQGSGKSLVGETLRRIYGKKHSAELKGSALKNPRNEWAVDKQFIMFDDITASKDRELQRQLMTMITQEDMWLDPKFIQSYAIKDRINYYFTSNDPDALFLDDKDRRFFVHEVLSGKFDYPAYVKWKNSTAGPAALWYYLLNLDISWFDPRAPAPDTLGKENMIEMGKSELGAWVRELRLNGRVMLERAGMKGDLFTARELHALFDPAGDARATPNALSRELKRAGFKAPATGSKIHTLDGQQLSVFAVFNSDKWSRASWKEACDHYNAHHPVTKPKGRKF